MFEKFENQIKRVEVYLVSALLFSVIAAMLLAILLRNFSSAAWALSYNEAVAGSVPHLVLAIGFLGASIGFSRGETIQIELLNRFYPERFRAWVIRVNYIVVATLIAIFFLLAARYLSGLETDGSDSRVHWVRYMYLPLFALLFMKTILVLLRPLRLASKEK